MAKLGTLLSRQIVGVVVLLYAVGFWRSATQLPDGPAVFYPQIVIAVLVLLIVLDAIRTSGHAVTGDLETGELATADTIEEVADRSATELLRDVWQQHQKTVVIIIVSAVYIYLIPTVGFYLLSAVYLAGTFFYLGIRRPVRLVALWAGTIAMFWFMFSFILSVRLPRGWWM